MLFSAPQTRECPLVPRPAHCSLSLNISSEGNTAVSFPPPPQTPDLDMSLVSTPPPFPTLSTQTKQRKHRSEPNYNSQKHLGPRGRRLSGRQVRLLHILLRSPGERLPATQAQGLHPEQGVSGSTFYPEPEPQACPFWYTEDSTPRGLSQNLLSATSASSRKPVGIVLFNSICSNNGDCTAALPKCRGP